MMYEVLRMIERSAARCLIDEIATNHGIARNAKEASFE